MKFLPCRNCTVRCRACGAVHAQDTAGQAARSGQYVSRYVCTRCRRPQALSAVDWARIPTPSLEEYEAHGLGDLATGDLVGAGLAKEEARDVFRAGLRTAHDIAALGPPQVDLRKKGEKPKEKAVGRQEDGPTDRSVEPPRRGRPDL